MNIRVNHIDFKGSIVDGPGIRTVIFLQGCVHLCRGCHNPATWNICGGKQINTKDLSDLIIHKSKNKKITISGGEPLLQLNEVMDLIQKLEGFDIALYTGFNIEAIPSELIDAVKYLKVGPYIESLSTTITPYVGSSNQLFLSMEA